MVLADPERVDAQPVGQCGLLDDVAQHLGVRRPPAAGSGAEVAERVEAEQQGCGHGWLLPVGPGNDCALNFIPAVDTRGTVRWDARVAGSAPAPDGDPGPDGVAAYVAAIDPAHRPLYDRIARLVGEVAPEAEAAMAYGMPVFRAGRHRLHVGVWAHGVSLYGWKAGGDGGFTQRHPGTRHGRGTIRLRPGDDVPDADLRALVRAVLVG